MRTLVLLVLLGVLGSRALAYTGEPIRLFSRQLRGPPPPVRSRDLDPLALAIKYTVQPVDHYGSTNETYKMRYITNDQYFKTDNSPIFIMLGGEWTINTGFVAGGHMFEIGKDVGAYLMYTEHRYYGKSHPTVDTSTKNLKFLRVDQALADVVGLIKEMKQEKKFEKSKVIVFGGSYAGNMATWIRLSYPDVIDGAVASSGPVLAKADFFEYLETVNDAMGSEGSDECLETIREGISMTQELLLTEEGAKNVSKLFGICNTINTKNELDVQTFFSLTTGSFSGLVQYARQGQIAAECAELVNKANGQNGLERLSRYIKKQAGTSCYDTEYDELMEYYKNISYEDENIYTSRLWLYQTCSEYGYYQTTNSKNQPFGDTHPLSYYSEHLCPDLYGESIDAEFLNSGIEQTNKRYGGLEPNATKVISVHGTIDPWHRLGIVKSLSNEMPAELIIGTSHCVDLQASLSSDLPQLKTTRMKVRVAVMKWLAN